MPHATSESGFPIGLNRSIATLASPLPTPCLWWAAGRPHTYSFVPAVCLYTSVPSYACRVRVSFKAPFMVRHAQSCPVVVVDWLPNDVRGARNAVQFPISGYSPYVRTTAPVTVHCLQCCNSAAVHTHCWCGDVCDAQGAEWKDVPHGATVIDDVTRLAKEREMAGLAIRTMLMGK